MPSKTVTFQSGEWLPHLRDAGSILFRYSILDTEFLGAVDEAQYVSNNDLVITISRSLKSIWKLGQADLEKVLFEYTKRHLAAKVKDDTLNQHEQIELQTTTEPNTCPYDPSRIEISFGEPIEFPVERPFGFRAK